MNAKHELLTKLFYLTGEIGDLAEEDDTYAKVYELLCDALDSAENDKLLTYEEET